MPSKLGPLLPIDEGAIIIPRLSATSLPNPRNTSGAAGAIADAADGAAANATARAAEGDSEGATEVAPESDGGGGAA